MDIFSVWSVFLFYALMASTFTFAKTAVIFMPPILFIGIRMLIGGLLLLGYLFFFNRKKWHFNGADWLLLLQIIVFHIYASYVFEYWGIQHMTSAKACLFYNFAPFITAILCYFLLHERLSSKKIGALFIGFLGMVPLSLTDLSEPCMGALSLADLFLLIAVGSAAYGWIIMHKLVNTRQYSPIMVNGIGMLAGGFLALITAFFFEYNEPLLRVPALPINNIHGWLIAHVGNEPASLCMLALSLFSLILIANIIGYNWYGYLLKHYSATLLSLAGLTAPLFAALYGWLFLSECIGLAFVLSAVITSLGVYLFYLPERR